MILNFKGALVFRITKFNIKIVFHYKQFIVTLLLTAYFRLNYKLLLR